MMRPLVIHVADNAMVEGLKGYFNRKEWHHALGCAPFDLDPNSERDFLKVPGSNDQAVWKFAHVHLLPFQKTHERAIIMLDEWFGDTPGAEIIQQEIESNMLTSGWDRQRFEVIVIRPMLEAWLWMESDHIAKAFGWNDFGQLKNRLVEENLWNPEEPKPHELKKAVQRASKLGEKKKRSGRRTFANVFAAVSFRSLDRCVEPGFHRFRETLRAWFPAEQGGRV
jgi:hypothetical protein